MKKTLLALTLFLISLSASINVANAKSFFSKNGYTFDIPWRHKVVERNFSEAYEKSGKDQKSMDAQILEDAVDASDTYITFIFHKKEKNPDGFHMNISTSDKVFEIADFDKTTWCSEFGMLFNQSIPNKNIELYECKMDATVMKNLKILKFVYDSIADKSLMYHYMFNFRDKTVNVAGICRENECDKTDKNLLYIIRSFNYL